MGVPTDCREPTKTAFVSRWLRDLSDEHDIVVSTQVTIEFRAVLTRRLVPAMSGDDVRTALTALAAFDVVEANANLVLDAHELAGAEQLS